MKKIIIASICSIISLLAILFLSFILICKYKYHESLEAGWNILKIRMAGSDTPMRNSNLMEKEIEKYVEINNTPASIPNSYYGVNIEVDKEIYDDEINYKGLYPFIYNKQESKERVIFYFPGGAFMYSPTEQQYKYCERVSKDTNSELVLINYPKAPVYDSSYSIDLCLKYYIDYLAKNNPSKVILFGDSAGGTMAMYLSLAIKEYNKSHVDQIKTPDEIILGSPAVNNSTTNPNRDKMRSLYSYDPSLGLEGPDLIITYWKGSLEDTDWRVSPTYGDLEGLGNITIVYGTREILTYDIDDFVQKLTMAGNNVSILKAEGMVHCFNIYEWPESKVSNDLIYNSIIR